MEKSNLLRSLGVPLLLQLFTTIFLCPWTYADEIDDKVAELRGKIDLDINKESMNQKDLQDKVDLVNSKWEELNLEEFFKTIPNPQDRKEVMVRAFLAGLPTQMRDNAPMAYYSQSAQTASAQKPRVILEDMQSFTEVAFTGEGMKGDDVLESIQLLPDSGRHQFLEVSFKGLKEDPPRPPSYEVNPTKCVSCHIGQRLKDLPTELLGDYHHNWPRPNWDNYPEWKRFFGEHENQFDYLYPLTVKSGNNYLEEFYNNSYLKGRYQYLEPIKVKVQFRENGTQPVYKDFEISVLEKKEVIEEFRKRIESGEFSSNVYRPKENEKLTDEKLEEILKYLRNKGMYDHFANRNILLSAQIAKTNATRVTKYLKAKAPQYLPLLMGIVNGCIYDKGALTNFLPPGRIPASILQLPDEDIIRGDSNENVLISVLKHNGVAVGDLFTNYKENLKLDEMVRREDQMVSKNDQFGFTHPFTKSANLLNRALLETDPELFKGVKGDFETLDKVYNQRFQTEEAVFLPLAKKSPRTGNYTIFARKTFQSQIDILKKRQKRMTLLEDELNELKVAESTLANHNRSCSEIAKLSREQFDQSEWKTSLTDTLGYCLRQFNYQTALGLGISTVITVGSYIIYNYYGSF